ncbi:hypothetical protein ACSQ67_004168 [Phaseolus vulgaris]
MPRINGREALTMPFVSLIPLSPLLPCLRCELCGNLVKYGLGSQIFSKEAIMGNLFIHSQVQLVRIQMRVPEYGWTTQKVFHLMNFVVNGLRAVLFGLYKNVFAIKPKALELVLMELPGLLFFSTYTLLVLFWAEIYHQICLWIYMSASKNATGFEAAELFLSVISFFASLGFLLYGGRLFFLLRRFPIESRGRQKKLYEVGSVTSICCTCFLIRCAMLAVSAFDKNTDLDVLDRPILNLVYYLMVEIAPSALVLFILRKLPPRRVSDQYHPIR